MPGEGAGKAAEALFAALALVLAIASILMLIAASGLPARWDVDGAKSILLPNGSADAERLLNPYGLKVLEYGGGYAIVNESMSLGDLQGLAGDIDFQNASQASGRIMAYRGPFWTVVFLKGYAMGEALSLGRVKRIGDEFSGAGRLGAYPIPEAEATGTTLYGIVRANLPLIVVGGVVLYGVYTVAKGFFFGKRVEEEG